MQHRKKICISIPCYNEEDNILNLYNAICKEFEENLPNYNFEIHFIDNCSQDKTQSIIRDLCSKDYRVKAIFNAKNFAATSKFYGMLQPEGDCTICMVADFQDPVNLIHTFVEEWEKGYTIVIGVKNSSREKKWMFALRSIYYWFMQKFAASHPIAHFNGFSLLDKSFVCFLRTLTDPIPSFRGLIMEYGYNIKKIEFIQPKRKKGKSKNNLYSLYDNAMLNITTYTFILPRLAVWIGGFVGSILSVVLGFYILTCFFTSYFINPLFVLIGIFMILFMVLLFFIGMVGEYCVYINKRILNRPLVLERERINYEDFGDKNV